MSADFLHPYRIQDSIRLCTKRLGAFRELLLEFYAKFDIFAEFLALHGIYIDVAVQQQ